MESGLIWICQTLEDEKNTTVWSLLHLPSQTYVFQGRAHRRQTYSSLNIPLMGVLTRIVAGSPLQTVVSGVLYWHCNFLPLLLSVLPYRSAISNLLASRNFAWLNCLGLHSNASPYDAHYKKTEDLFARVPIWVSVARHPVLRERDRMSMFLRFGS